MKRFFLVSFGILTLIAAFAQWQHSANSPVSRFLDEYATHQGFIKSNNLKAEAMYEREFAPTRMIKGVECADAFISFSDKSVISSLKAQGVIVNCVFDDFLTAQIPMSKLESVSRMPGVTNVEMSRLLEWCTDSTLNKTHAGMVLNGSEYGLPQAYDGTGVIVGIIDFGFDYQHSAFKRADNPNQSRIMRVYDPDNTTGHPVYLGENQLPGSVFMGEQIDTLTTDCTETHGTHTTSIAAGTHEAGYGGMAPGADIVMCTSRVLNTLVHDVEIVNCLKYIYSYADSVGKPCVVSLSVSTSNGPHDGSDYISKAIAKLVGPGRIFVIAAGNNGDRAYYCTGCATRTKPVNMLLGCSSDNIGVYADEGYYYSSVWVDTWVREKYVTPVIKFHIFDRTNQRIVWESDYITQYKKIDSSEFSQFFKPDSAVNNEGSMEASISCDLSAGKYKVTTKIRNLKTTSYYYNSHNGCFYSQYKIGLSFYAPSLYNPRWNDSCTVDSWQCNSLGIRGYYDGIVYVNETQDDGTVITKEVEGFYASPSSNCSIGSYAVHDSIISAGGYNGRNCFYSYKGVFMTDDVTVGKYYTKSSYQRQGTGPKKTALPTVVAPSFNVVSAISQYSSFYMNEPGYSYLVRRNSSGYYWGVMTGTSMAAPTVAGIIAQWLQINPNLSPGDIKRIIAETAIKDSFTTDPDSYYRYGPNGKIDAMAGARHILGLDVEEPVLIGDINGDGKVSMADLTLLIDYVLGYELDTFNIEAADIQGDGRISIADVSSLIDMVLELE